MLGRQRSMVGFISLLSAAAAVGCSSPTPPTPKPLQIACPADIQAISTDGQPVSVAVPHVESGGVPVTCLPQPADHVYPVGTTVTSCSTSTLPNRASCAFRITVTVPPRLAYTRFVAFGDSLTAGTISPDAFRLLVSVPDSYPFKLGNLLAARYVGQTVTVLDEGQSGEWIVDALKGRFQAVLDADAPQVLLLLDGANDLLNLRSTAIPQIVDGLSTMTRTARQRGIAVMLATFPPQNPNGSRGAGASAVPDLNRRIVALAAEQGAMLVDLYSGLGGSPVGVIGVDGLHPTADGYTRIAQLWFDAIVSSFEAPSSAGVSASTGGGSIGTPNR
jgi:lysophospholipase L1-like esterase